MGVGLGDHLVADDVEHGAACKGKGKGQNGRREADGEIAQKGADHLHETGAYSNEKGPLLADAGAQHGRDDDHALGNVLQGDAAGNEHGLRHVIRAEADAGGDALRQVVDGNGGDEQQNLA